MISKEQKWVVGIFVATLAVRLLLAFSVPHFTYESYFHLRQVESISQTGFPLYNDPLSYGGRELRFLPFFHYVMAFFSLFLPLEVAAKIIPNIFLASITIIVYLISRRVVQDTTPSLFSAFIAGFLPILFSTNAFVVETLFIPLIFLTLYCFQRISEEKYLVLYITTFFLLCLTSAATILLLIGLGLYFLLSMIERKKIERAEVELTLFSFFLYLWVQFLFFKNTFLQEGITFVWQNIPPQIIQNYFPSLSIVEALVLVSVIPFLAGVYVVYSSLFQFKNQQSFLLISLVVSTTILTWLKLIQFNVSLAFFGVVLAILFSLFYQETIVYLRKTKIETVMHYFPYLIITLLVVTMIYPAMETALQQDTPSDEEIQAFRWMGEHLPSSAHVVALLEEGHLVTFYAHRQNIIDDQFRRISDVETRLADVSSLFTTKFQTLALDLFSKYNSGYIIFTPHAKEKYHQDNLRYLSVQCFERAYKEQEAQEIKIYRVKCALGKVEEE